VQNSISLLVYFMLIISIAHVDINLGSGAIRSYEFKLKGNETPSLDFDKVMQCTVMWHVLWTEDVHRTR